MTGSAAGSIDEEPALRIENLGHHYGPLQALAGISLEVRAGEIFGLLGPNGGGKTTLFRILSTVLPPSSGRAEIFGIDLRTDPAGVRETIGVVFQRPSLDAKLTVRENLRHHGHLYGLRGSELDVCMDASMRRLAIRDRADDIVEQLSGGLQRRVELAKGLVTRPRLLILDEPATGLDPGARIDLWRHLSTLRSEDGVTILVTTHLMDEAEHCDRLAILDNGRIVAIGTPSELKRKIGGDIITIETPEPEKLSSLIAERFGTVPTHLGETLLLEQADGHVMVGQLVEAFSERISSISLGKPTLEDVFIHETGHRFWEDA
jgi:ABC-2 type transport system ATP-binding protein